MHLTTLLFPLTAAAAHVMTTPHAPQAMPSIFGLMALRSASPIHFGTVNAAGGNFWIGKNPPTLCPGVFNGTCVNATSTVFNAPDEYGGLSLDVLVEGGQKVYVDATCGAVKYTRPHGALPTGANATGWELDSFGVFFDYLEWVAGTVFCPMGNGTTGTRFGQGPWQMYALLDGIRLPKGCLGASLLALDAKESRTWAYR